MIPLLPAEEALKRFKDSGIADAVKDPALAKGMSRLNVFRALLNNPTITLAQSGMAGALMGSKTLDHRLRELVILRTGWRTKSEYEFVQHVGVSRRMKMTDEEILGVRNPAECKAYNDIDLAVIAMADELHDHSQVSAKTWAALEKAFSAAQLVELILVAGFWHMMAGFLKTAEIPLDPIDPTLSGWPEGKAPA
jgi:4-carboxymuconolactone decarboxylase